MTDFKETEVVHTSSAPAAVGPYSQGKKGGGLIFVSGQLPIDPQSGQLLEPDIRAQTAQSLENLKQVLLAGGSSLEKVLKVTVYLRRMGDFAEMNEVYAGYFAADPPARAAVEVSRLPKDALVEIEAVALA